MNKIEEYRQNLQESSDWFAYLKENSNLPGPRGNLELAYAAAQEGDEAFFIACLEHTPEQAPENTPECFLAFCGTLGLGKLIREGRVNYWQTLRHQANDPRWRVREAAAMASQTIGDANLPALLEEMSNWVQSGTWLEQRAAAAGLCEPRLLKNAQDTRQVLLLLDIITNNLLQSENRKAEDLRVLRQGLAYTWSVAIAACPLEGKIYMEKWAAIEDTDIRWIVKENLKKKRLLKIDPTWVEDIQQKILAMNV
jgi:hypothetical protein